MNSSYTLKKMQQLSDFRRDAVFFVDEAKERLTFVSDEVFQTHFRTFQASSDEVFDVVDARLYAATSDSFLKVARILLDAYTHFKISPLPVFCSLTPDMLATRLFTLFERGVLEVHGDFWRPRFSEVKRTSIPFQTLHP
jgi:hypothetical protein